VPPALSSSFAASPPLPALDPPLPETDRRVICNYMGIGVDAVIAHNFANMRDKYPNLFFSQFANKLWYARIGSEAYFFPDSPLVLQESKVQVFVDGCELDLAGLQGICILNIKSFGGGINFWGYAPTDGEFVEPRIDDQLLEVIGFRSSLHMGTIQLGMALPHRLAQGKHLLIRTRGPLPFQVDGEPWGVKRACEVHVSLRNQALMLSPSTDELEGSMSSTLADVLFWAEQRKVLDSRQRTVILKEFARRHGQVVPSSAFYKPLPVQSSES